VVGEVSVEQASTSRGCTVLLVAQQVLLSALQARTDNPTATPGGGPPAPSGEGGR
jgi:hypothetical protein